MSQKLAPPPSTRYGVPILLEASKQLKQKENSMANEHAVPEAGPAQAVSPRGRFFATQTFHYEALRNAGYILACYDFGALAAPLLAAAKNPLAMNIIAVSWAYRNALWTMGTKDVDETIQACAAYTLAPVADRIRQDVLILAGTEDHFIPLHQTADFEKALVNARSVTTRIFDGPSGGSGHCQCGALTLYHAAVFDWLLEKFPANPRG